MPRGLLRAAIALAATAAGGVAIAACGSQTRTVTVSSAPRPSLEGRNGAGATTTSTTRSSSSTSSSSSSSSTATGTTTVTQATATTTRTSTAPAFVGPSRSGGNGLRGAVATLEGQGYAPTEPTQFHPSQTLEVMVGRKRGEAEGQPQQRAFFFLNGKYLGTDASGPSASIKVVSEADTEVTLAYALYRLHGNSWQPTGSTAKVSFQLNDGKLVALQAIPPARPARGAGRL